MPEVAETIPFDFELRDPCAIRTFTGRTFCLAEPRSADVDIVDIAVSLSRAARYNGHTPITYSVAQHSVLACDLCPELPLVALMHDAAEAYTGDMTRPWKVTLGRELVRSCEDRIHKAIAAKFGLLDYMPGQVKLVDDRLLITEQRDLMGRRPREGEQPYAIKVVPVGEYRSLIMFLEAFEEFSGFPVNWSAVPARSNLERG